MATKVVIVLISSDIDAIKTGLLYGKNAMQYGWMEDVKLFVFGKAEETILEDENLLKEIKEINGVACKFIAKEKNIYEKLKQFGITTDYIGESFSNLIKEGYAPITF